VFACEIFEVLKDAEDPVPDHVAQALGLPLGSSFAAATVPVIEAWNAPQVPTPEEEAEHEAFALLASEIFEQLNERNPDMPSAQ
jgi:hypothetical protein